MDRLDALREGFQGVTSIENAPRTIPKRVDHSLGFGTLQEHDGRSTMRVPRFLKDLDAFFGAVLKFFTNQCHVWCVGTQLANNLLRTAGQSFNRETSSAVHECIL
jgi:hypothetical protein